VSASISGFGRKEKDGETGDFFERPRGVSLCDTLRPAGGAFNSQKPLGWPSLSVLELCAISRLLRDERWATLFFSPPAGWPVFELIPESWGRFGSPLFFWNLNL